MKVLVFEENLMWSVKVANNLTKLGHLPEVISAFPDEIPDADVAIINLGSIHLKPSELVARLKEKGIRTIGHAGHKEKPLLEYGNEVGCDEVVSNSTITFKLETLLV